ncbi:hypothetical protein PRIPAC_84198 [Pristionchus pacificus]|uniref:Uncharacterized protein n=1 Tax=Pristionchus pacificus TaxID=54126 RepID=A0A2A6CEK5_PRIPA|nr:hypothetical protein PRIPAC_84198 [Pristionchus pacificus]|eukprot:PDM76518.1 hypothetical protein PRIPAC_42884 [Pristionchus pacificus]
MPYPNRYGCVVLIHLYERNASDVLLLWSARLVAGLQENDNDGRELKMLLERFLENDSSSRQDYDWRNVHTADIPVENDVDHVPQCSYWQTPAEVSRAAHSTTSFVTPPPDNTACSGGDYFDSHGGNNKSGEVIAPEEENHFDEVMNAVASNAIPAPQHTPIAKPSKRTKSVFEEVSDAVVAEKFLFRPLFHEEIHEKEKKSTCNETPKDVIAISVLPNPSKRISAPVSKQVNKSAAHETPEHRVTKSKNTLRAQKPTTKEINAAANHDHDYYRKKRTNLQQDKPRSTVMSPQNDAPLVDKQIDHQNWPRRSAKFFDPSSTLKLKEKVPESYKGSFFLTKEYITQKVLRLHLNLRTIEVRRIDADFLVEEFVNYDSRMMPDVDRIYEVINQIPYFRNVRPPRYLLINTFHLPSPIDLDVKGHGGDRFQVNNFNTNAITHSPMRRANFEMILEFAMNVEYFSKEKLALKVKETLSNNFPRNFTEHWNDQEQ